MASDGVITVHLPSGTGGFGDGSAEYQVLQFPIPLEAIAFGPRGRTSEEGRQYLDWLAATESQRASYMEDVLRGLGAPVPSRINDDRELAAIDDWLVPWWPSVMDQWKGECWRFDPFGYPRWAPPDVLRSPQCRTFHQLTLSFAHDLGFVVIAAARRRNTALRWELVTDPSESVSPQRVSESTNLPGLGPKRRFVFPELWSRLNLLKARDVARQQLGRPSLGMEPMFRDLISGGDVAAGAAPASGAGSKDERDRLAADVARRVDPNDSDIQEEWVRESDEPDLRYVRAYKPSNDAWRVWIAAAEFLRVEPLRSRLYEHVTAVLEAVRGVTEVIHEDTEQWIAVGSPLGEELVTAASIAVDDLASEARQHLHKL